MKKYQFIIRRCVLLMLALVSWTAIQAASPGTVTIKAKNYSLQQVLKQIEQQTDYRFSYKDADLKGFHAITATFDNTSVNEVLYKLFQDSKLSYEIVSSKSIVILPRRKSATTSDANSNGNLRGLNQGIDFSGGRNYVVQFDHPVKTHELQAKLAPLFDGAQVSVITIDDNTKVRVSTNYKIDSEDENIDAEITEILYNGMKDEIGGMSMADFSTTNENVGIQSSQKVGPTVANDMRTDAYIAVILSLIAMFLYILIRFRNIAFSVGALAAVAFTAFSIIGFYSLFWGVFPFAMEVDQTFIAAILTVIGYQINDTVVVFDRVRENIGLYPKQDFFTNVNRSINSTLSRTVMTSASTLLVLLCIFILGGDSIRSFTFAMIFGVVIGTLATMFVAAPVAYLTDSRRAAGKKA